MDTQRQNDLALGFRFLAAALQDEPAAELLQLLAGESFFKGAEDSGFWERVQRLISFCQAGDAQEQLAQARYDYADLFLNAGPDPVFAYHSLYTEKVSTVQQKPLFDLRGRLRELDLRVREDFMDLDEHIAVELELCAWLLEQSREDDFTAFFGESLMAWAPQFFARLQESAGTDFYKGLGDLGAAFLECVQGSAGGFCAGLAAALRAAGFAPGVPLLVPGAKPAEPDREIPTHCYTCGALCGMTAKVSDGVMQKTGGLPGDPKGGGKVCPKGAAAARHVNSPHRLKSPLIRENGRFRKAGWDEALNLVAVKLQAVPEGKLAYFRGNDYAKFVHEAFFDALGCPKGTHRTMCDNSNRMTNEHTLNDKRPWINYQESEYIILFGLNELATSYGQRKTAEFKKALSNGAELVVFDPRKSETAAKATEWLQIVPGTDGAAAMAMAYVIISEDLYDKEFVEHWTTGFAEFKARVLGEEDGVPRTPQWAQEITGVPAEALERVAREFAAAKSKGAISWTGLAQTYNGHWSTAAVQALNGLCGTFDAPGGPSLPFKRKLGSAWGEGQAKPEKKAAPKVNDFLLWSGWSPALFEDQVNEGKLQAMVCYWGDPVLTWGNSESVKRGLEKLDFLVVIDAFMCNTALLADVVLPESTWLEHPDLKPDWLYEAFLSYFAEVVKPMYDTRPMWRICQGLAERMGVHGAAPWSSLDEAHANQLRGTPWTLEELKEKGFIITDEARYYKYKEWSGLNPPEGYASSGKSRTGKYNFVNPVSAERGVDALPDHKPIDALYAPDVEYPFIFGNFRLFVHEHCSTFNNVQLMKLQGTNSLVMNDEDAAELGLSSGDQVRVSSPWGQTEIPVEPTPDMRRGVLGAAGGFGHLRGLEGDPKFPQFGGVNAPGALMPPNSVEPTGGTPPLKYIKARVEKAG